MTVNAGCETYISPSLGWTWRLYTVAVMLTILNAAGTQIDPSTGLQHEKGAEVSADVCSRNPRCWILQPAGRQYPALLATQCYECPRGETVSSRMSWLSALILIICYYFMCGVAVVEIRQPGLSTRKMSGGQSH